MGESYLRFSVKLTTFRRRAFLQFNFFPFFSDSNLDTRICYNVFYGEIIRIQRSTSSKEDFEVRVKFLTVQWFYGRSLSGNR